MRSDVLGALAVMLGVGYLVFRESGGGSMSVPSTPSRSVPSHSQNLSHSEVIYPISRD